MVDDGRISARWRVSPEDAAAVAADYGLTIDASTLHPLGGAINGVARVASNRGDVVIRVHRTSTTTARLASLHAVQRRLSEYGLPVTDILRTLNGESWTTLHGRLAEVSFSVPHGRESASWDDGMAVMAMLGRFHAALKDVESAGLPAPRLSCFATPATALEMLARSDPAFHTRSDHPRYEPVAAARREATALYHALDAVRASYEDVVPRSLIHGDFVGANVLLDDMHRVVAILDFDRLAVRERVYDVAYTLSYLIPRAVQSDLNVDLSDADLSAVASLLAAYHAHSPLIPEELAALPYEMARTPLYPIASAGFAGGGPDLKEAFTDTLIFAAHLPTARWFARHADHVTRSLARSLPM